MQVSSVFEWNNKDNINFYGNQLEAAAKEYEDNVLPPFFATLKKYVEKGNDQFDCPGHQDGSFFRKHPAGKL